MRSTTRLAPCSVGAATPAKSASASIKTRGLPGVVVIVLVIVLFALFAQIMQQFLDAQTGFNPCLFNLSRQLRHHRYHWCQHEDPVEIDQAKCIAGPDAVFLTQFDR